MTIRFLLLVALTAMVGWGIPAPAAAAADGTTCQRLLPELKADLGAAGASCAVIRGGEVAEQFATGKDGHGAPMTTSTPGVFGSVSKPMLATVAARLAATKRVNLDEPVVKALPEFRVRGGGAVTPRQLLSHTSGLPFGAEFLDVDDPGRRPVEVVRRLDGVRLASPAGSQYRYSSLGYLVLSAWLEAATGETTADQLSSLDLPGLLTRPGDRSVPPGNRGWLGWTSPAPADGAGLGYGYTAGSIESLAAFARASLADRPGLEWMTAGERPLGWRVDTVAGEQRVWHTGTVPGYFSAIHMIPAQGLAVVVMVNRSGFLDEQRLYDTSHALLVDAMGGSAKGLGVPWVSVGSLLVMVLATAGGLVLATRSRLWLCLVGVPVLGLVVATPWIGVWSMGMPARAAWLWAPDLLAASGLGALGLLVAGGVLVRRAAGTKQGRN